jgi:hypothetical protein
MQGAEYHFGRRVIDDVLAFVAKSLDMASGRLHWR